MDLSGIVKRPKRLAAKRPEKWSTLQQVLRAWSCEEGADGNLLDLENAKRSRSLHRQVTP
jgi:hypothetical protein